MGDAVQDEGCDGGEGFGVGVLAPVFGVGFFGAGGGGEEAVELVEEEGVGVEGPAVADERRHGFIGRFRLRWGRLAWFRRFGWRGFAGGWRGFREWGGWSLLGGRRGLGRGGLGRGLGLGLGFLARVRRGG